MVNCRCCKTKEVRLVFHRAQLLYDIGNYAFVEGDLLGDESEHVAHQVKDIVESGNVDRVTRVLNLAHRECEELLYPWTKLAVEDGTVLDDRLVVPDRYEIVLTVPSTFARTTVELLRDSIHEYMVCRVLQDWLSLTNTPGAAAWDEKLAGIKAKIQQSLLSRTRYVHRKLKPF